jgi:hypothetical protein
VVNISSLAGLRCNSEMPAFCATKGGLINLTQQAALDEATTCDAMLYAREPPEPPCSRTTWSSLHRCSEQTWKTSLPAS